MAESSERLEPSFLGVPCEIRMLVYDKLVGDRVFWVNFPHDGSLHFRALGFPAIMRVNKQVRHEAQRAVKVRTLRVNRFKMEDVRLLSRIPRIVSQWAPKIESVLIGYYSYEFELLVGRHGDTYATRLLTGLKQILVHLPRMKTLTITCNGLLDYSQDRELEGQLSRFSKQLSSSLPRFDRIQIQMNRMQNWAASSEMEEVEIRLSRGAPKTQQRAEAASQDAATTTTTASRSERRRVLLDVIKISDSKTERWLTINEVNQ